MYDKSHITPSLACEILNEIIPNNSPYSLNKPPPL